MKKIVFIDHEPLTVRRCLVFHIDELLERGLDVEFWDCSKLFYPKAVVPDKIDRAYRYAIGSFCELDAQFAKIDITQTVFVIEVLNEWGNRKFFQMISRKGCYQIKIELYSNTTLPDISVIEKIMQSSPSKLLEAAINKINQFRYKLYKIRHHIKDFDKYLNSGTNPSIDVPINHPDWEQFVAAVPYVNEREYAVFIDQFYPLHPDFAHVKEKLGDVEKYQQSIRKFFDYFEQHTGLEVIVAAHPKADYKGGELGNRKYVTYKTAELVKGASCALLHSSAAVSFVVIADLPFALITNDEHQVSFGQASHLKRFAHLFKRLVYNTDRVDVDLIKVTLLDEPIRRQYIYDFLTSAQTENRSNGDILFDFLGTL